MVELISSIKVPNSWKELVELKSILPICVPGVARLPEDLRFYRIYKELVPKEIRLEIIKTLIGDKNICLLQNNFPYTRLLQNLPKVKHYCLWSRKYKLTSKTIEKEIKKNFPENEFFYFENIEAVKSVPEIWHCQIFVRLD